MRQTGLLADREQRTFAATTGIQNYGYVPLPLILTLFPGDTAGVLIRPTGIDEIRRTADERLLMPPKSTFFTPKLRTGLVLRPLS